MPLPLNLPQGLKDRLQQAQEAYDQIFGPFDRGEFREITDQEWKALVDGL